MAGFVFRSTTNAIYPSSLREQILNWSKVPEVLGDPSKKKYTYPTRSERKAALNTAIKKGYVRKVFDYMTVVKANPFTGLVSLSADFCAFDCVDDYDWKLIAIAMGFPKTVRVVEISGHDDGFVFDGYWEFYPNGKPPSKFKGKLIPEKLYVEAMNARSPLEKLRVNGKNPGVFARPIMNGKDYDINSCSIDEWNRLKSEGIPVQTESFRF